MIIIFLLGKLKYGKKKKKKEKKFKRSVVEIGLLYMSMCCRIIIYSIGTNGKK